MGLFGTGIHVKVDKGTNIPEEDILYLYNQGEGTDNWATSASGGNASAKKNADHILLTVANTAVNSNADATLINSVVNEYAEIAGYKFRQWQFVNIEVQSIAGNPYGGLTINGELQNNGVWNTGTRKVSIGSITDFKLGVRNYKTSAGGAVATSLKIKRIWLSKQ